MKKIVEIKWDKPKEKNWLCDENIKYALQKCCPNTKFEVCENNRHSWFSKLNLNQKTILRVAANLLKSGTKIELSPKKW